MAELWDLKLKGRAAVAMTPFCDRDANRDTTGFRFFAQVRMPPPSSCPFGCFCPSL